jgi:hypothetical protein
MLSHSLCKYHLLSLEELREKRPEFFQMPDLMPTSFDSWQWIPFFYKMDSCPPKPLSLQTIQSRIV